MAQDGGRQHAAEVAEDRRERVVEALRDVAPTLACGDGTTALHFGLATVCLVGLLIALAVGVVLMAGLAILAVAGVVAAMGLVAVLLQAAASALAHKPAGGVRP